MDNPAIVVPVSGSTYDSVSEATHPDESVQLSEAARISLIDQRMERGVWRGSTYLSLSNAVAYEINHQGEGLEEEMTPDEIRIEAAADILLESNGDCPKCVRCGMPERGGAFCSDACREDYTEALRQKLATEPRAELNALERYVARNCLGGRKTH